ncbi:hypothetical protein C8J56DRAFT_1042855 [Mycena floridula]|nr:hypothetical protein C8J56DRAFT_1042855 [Mycena floridula]
MTLPLANLEHHYPQSSRFFDSYPTSSILSFISNTRRLQYAGNLEIFHPEFRILHLLDVSTELLGLRTLPSLLDFSFAADGPWPQASFEAMIERSSFKLTTLGIHCKEIRTTEIDLGLI